MAHRSRKPHHFRALSKPKHINKNEHRHYLPYLPMILIVIATFVLNMGQTTFTRAILAYSTDVTASGLLVATNRERTNKGSGQLRISSALASAAQAKADDMVARNYWSHNTPDGDLPWVFLDKTGYKYLKAGENLAYGFLTSDDTVAGWMNSQTHRDNLLDSAFSEVGFGFANGESYNNSGKETVVVAMYGKPQVLSQNNQPVAAPTTQPNSAPPASANSESDTLKPNPLNSDSRSGGEPASREITKVQTLTNGQAPWALFASGLIVGLAIMLLLVRHAAQLRHLIKNSERFILHHPLYDTVLVSLVFIGSLLSQTAGIIK